MKKRLKKIRKAYVTDTESEKHQIKKNKAAIRLLEGWLNDKEKKEYDETAYPIIKKLLKENKL